MKCYNILIMIEESDKTKVLWLDYDNNLLPHSNHTMILVNSNTFVLIHHQPQTKNKSIILHTTS